MKYFVNFHTGSGDFEFEGSLYDAEKEAGRSVGYTGKDVTIEDSVSDTVYARLPWNGVEYDENEHGCEEPICFGTFGFYGDWIEY